MCLSCTGKTWISVLVRKWSVFQNTVTYYKNIDRKLVIMQAILYYINTNILVNYSIEFTSSLQHTLGTLVKMLKIIDDLLENQLKYTGHQSSNNES